MGARTHLPEQNLVVNDVFYDLPSTISPRKGATLGGRTKLEQQRQRPGPADYEVPEPERTGHKHSFAGRTLMPGIQEYDIKYNDNPGPIYDLKQAKPGKDIHMRFRIDDPRGVNVPGPGHYDYG